MRVVITFESFRAEVEMEGDYNTETEGFKEEVVNRLEEGGLEVKRVYRVKKCPECGNELEMSPNPIEGRRFYFCSECGEWK